jgi:hypothetical protein
LQPFLNAVREFRFAGENTSTRAAPAVKGAMSIVKVEKPETELESEIGWPWLVSDHKLGQLRSSTSLKSAVESNSYESDSIAHLLSYLQETIEIFSSSSVSEGNDMIASHGPDRSSSALKVDFGKTGSFVTASLRMVQERMVLSMRSWASSQLSQNKQAISKLGDRVRGHWRGDLSLFQIYFTVPL